MNDLSGYFRLLSPHNRRKPRFAALASAVLSQTEDLFSLLSSLPSAWSLEEAVGPQLEAFAALAGVPRPPNASDADFSSSGLRWPSAAGTGPTHPSRPFCPGPFRAGPRPWRTIRTER